MKTLITVAVVLVIGFLGLAYSQNWFTVETREQPRGKAELTITVDRQKADKDVEQAKEALQEKAREAKEAVDEGADDAGENAADAANRLAGATIVEGEITKVNPEENKVTIQAGEKQYEVVVNRETKMLRNGDAIHLDALRAGNKAKVSFKENEGKNVAWRVLVRTEKKTDKS